MTTHIIIPSRYDSTRLPGKALLLIAGKPLLQHVYERALQTGIKHVVIATDDKRIERVAQGFGAQVIMTGADHATGTDRIAEAAEKLGAGQSDIIINVQGDEPLFPLQSVKQLDALLTKDARLGMATLCSPLRGVADLFDTNVVKVVRDKHNNALYFSRATIPWSRDALSKTGSGETVDLSHYRWHIGLYAYRLSFLQRYVDWGISPLEQVEQLEQLRVLWHGEQLHVADAKERSLFDVNTQEDLERVQAWFAKN